MKHPKKFAWFVLTIAAGAAAGCSIPNPLLGGYPTDAAIPTNVSRSHPTVHGFTVGERYQLKSAAWLHETFGEHLLRESNRSNADFPVAVFPVPSGTTFRIAKTKRWQTITRGYEFQVFAKVENGPARGKEVRLFQDDRAMLRLIK